MAARVLVVMAQLVQQLACLQAGVFSMWMRSVWRMEIPCILSKWWVQRRETKFRINSGMNGGSEWIDGSVCVHCVLCRVHVCFYDDTLKVFTTTLSINSRRRFLYSHNSSGHKAHRGVS